MELSTRAVREFFWKNPKGSLYVPTKTRDEIIAEEGFSTDIKMSSQGRIYNVVFKNAGGGMWYTYLKDLVTKL